MSHDRVETGSDRTTAATGRSSDEERKKVLAMTPREALLELDKYITNSSQHYAFGKTRAQAAHLLLWRLIEGGDDGGT